MHIYIHRDGQQLGPFPMESVRDDLESGTLLPDDLAWYEGAEGWKPLPEVLAEFEAVPAPADEPAPAPLHPGEHEPEPERVQEPDPAPSPEPSPVSARLSEPSWIPPRRDGSTPVPFAQPSRMALPENLRPALSERPAPDSVQPTVAREPDPASPPDAPTNAPDDTAPSEAQAKVKRRRSAPQEVWNPEMMRARRMIIGGGIAVFTGIGLYAFTHFVTPSETSLKMVAGGLVLLGGSRLLFGIYRYRQRD